MTTKSRSVEKTTDSQSTRAGGIRARIVSWMTAGVVLLGFCWLAFVTPIFTDILRGFETRLPALTRFSMAYGRLAFPIFGILGATSIIFAERVGRRQLFQALLFAALVAVIVVLFRSLLISGSFMGPVTIHDP